jgi:N-acetylmuramoyl-L-alanine amidase
MPMLVSASYPPPVAPVASVLPAPLSSAAPGAAGPPQATTAPVPLQPGPAVVVAPRLVQAGHTTASPTLARRVADRGLKVIVVDAGHGGHDTGARSQVRNEKDINLAAALALKARLEKMGRYKVVLTRDADVFIPLETRVQIARQAKADLFISLHSDSAGSDPVPHGASVYTLSDHGQTRVSTVLGPHEWFAQAGDRRTEPAVRQILLDLTQRSTRNRSSEFAGLLIGHIGDRVDLLPRSHRDASYFVLLAPDVPAVLLEMGFITNPADEMRLTDPAQRESLMNGVAEAIDAYFSGGTRLSTG